MISRTANENWPGAWNMAFAIHRQRCILRRACECAVRLGTTFLLFCLMAAAWTAPLPPNQNSPRIYFVDVEGGQATLFVTPTGRSLLIDTGWPGNDGRDADRILAAAIAARFGDGPIDAPIHAILFTGVKPLQAAHRAARTLP